MYFNFEETHIALDWTFNFTNGESFFLLFLFQQPGTIKIFQQKLLKCSFLIAKVNEEYVNCVLFIYV